MIRWVPLGGPNGSTNYVTPLPILVLHMTLPYNHF